MKKLNLPIIKGKGPSKKWLSMDDYIKFINLHKKYTLNRKIYKKLKKLSGVNVPFLLE